MEDHFAIYVKNREHAKKVYGVQLVYKRDLNFYVAHVVMPMLLLQVIELTAYKLNPLEDYNDIINLIIITLLTTVAFRFSLVGIVPVVSYIMYIDYYMLFGYLLPTILACFEFSFANNIIHIDYRRAIYLTIICVIVVFNMLFFCIGIRSSWR